MTRPLSSPVHPWRRRIGVALLLALIVGGALVMWNSRGAASGVERATERWREVNRSMP